jgi:adenylate cyclase
MNHIHERYLRHFIQQDVVGHKEVDLDEIHVGNAIYRDGDYFGRDVNISARVAARSAGGEVLVTRPVDERAGSHLKFDRIGEIKLKGFSVSTEMFVARLSSEEE